MAKYRGTCSRPFSHVRSHLVPLTYRLATIVALCIGGPLVITQPALPLQARSPRIVDSNRNRMRLNAFDWHGPKSTDYVVSGLQIAPLRSIVQRAQNLAFSAARFPWSNQLYEYDPIVASLTADPQGFMETSGVRTPSRISVRLDQSRPNANKTPGWDLHDP